MKKSVLIFFTVILFVACQDKTVDSGSEQAIPLYDIEEQS